MTALMWAVYRCSNKRKCDWLIARTHSRALAELVAGYTLANTDDGTSVYITEESPMKV